MDISFENKLKFFYNFDLFGKAPELYYKGKIKRFSYIGLFFTILYFVLYIVIFIYKFIKMIKKAEISFYETYAYSGDTPSIKISNKNFYAGFAIGETPFIDETIYYPKVVYYKGIRKGGKWTWTFKPLELKRCEIDDFDPRYRDIFIKLPLNDLYCLKNLDETLDGYYHLDIYSYFSVTFYPCNFTKDEGKLCKSPLVIEKYLKSNIFQFFIQDIDLSPQYYKNPIHIKQKIIQGPLYTDLFNKIYTYLQIVNVETDEDFIGLNAFSKSNSEKFLKYDTSWVMPAPIIDGKTYDKGFPICEIIVQLSDKVLTQKRTFVKLIEILGEVGGSMEVILKIFSIICSFLTSALYRTSLVNNLFSFDIQKKVIFIKENKNYKINDSIAERIYRDFSKSKNFPKNLKIINNDIIKMPDELNNERIINQNQTLILGRTLRSQKKVKKKLKKEIIDSNSIVSNEKKELKINNISNIIQKDSINNKNTINEFDLNDNNNKKEKEYIKENEKNNIINRIEINRCYFFLWILCYKRKKNVQNILLVEAIGIIVKRLDILNIFKTVFRDEKIHKLFEKQELIEMSYESRKNLDNI